MKRLLSLALLAGLLAGIGVAGAQEARTIKLKELAAGESAEIERTETVKATTLIVDGKGEKLRDTTNTTVETSRYTETVVQRDGKKAPTRLERAYTKAQFSVGAVTKDLAYQGKTLVIERTGDKYTFTDKGGAALTPADTQLLDKEFNANTENRAEQEKLLLPTGPVKASDVWQLDMATVLKPLQKSGDMSFDTRKASGTGTLTKVYQKDDKTFGELHYLMKIPVTTLGKEKQKLDLADGSYANFDVSMDVCIDGQACSGTMKTKTDLLAKSSIPAPSGGTAELSLTVAREVQETRKELPKK